MRPIDQLNHRLEAGDVIVIDGGMGSEIEARGVEMHDEAWCALANVEHPDVVQEIHEDYIRAGADVIITNTFPADRSRLEAAGYGDRWEEINRAAVSAALRARDAVGRSVVVAGSVCPVADLSDSPSPAQLQDGFAAQAVTLASAGADLIALEGIGPGPYAEPAMEGVKQAGLPIWLGVSVSLLHGDGVTDDGDLDDPADRQAMEEVLGSFATSDIAAVTVMHSNIDQVDPALELVRSYWDGPLGAYPHFGEFQPPHWRFKDISPEAFLAEARGWVDRGAQLVGGCCGIRPAHIAALSNGLPSSIAA